MSLERYTLHYETRGQVVVSERSGNREETTGEVSVNYQFDIVETAVDDLRAELHSDKEHKATVEHAETVVIIHDGENERNDHVEDAVLRFLEANGFKIAA